MYVNPGELRKKIQIVADSGEKDEDGFPVGDKIVHKCSAKYSRKTGTEKDGAGAEINEVAVRFLIRYTKKALHKNMKVLYAGKRYDIQDINDIQDEHRYMEIFCKVGDL